MVGRRLRSVWTLVNVVMTLVLVPMFLISWNDPCNREKSNTKLPFEIDLGRNSAVPKEDGKPVMLASHSKDSDPAQGREELSGPQGKGGAGGGGGGGGEEEGGKGQPDIMGVGVRREDSNIQRRRREEKEEEEKEEEEEEEGMVGRGRRGGVRRGEEGEGVYCPPAGSGAFSPVKLRSTALASYQGSGNTWTRHLLTTATGILTGTVYANETREVPAGEQNSRAYRLLVIKTHMNPRETRHHFPMDRGILIVRNPYEAILSEFNRGGINPDDDRTDKRHVAVRRPEDFRQKWPRYVEYQMQMWLKFNWYWAKDRAPLHVLVYHRLVESTTVELEKVLQFLNESSLQQPALHCATRHSEGWAHRQKPEWQRQAAVFNASQTAFLNTAIAKVQMVLQTKTGHSFQDFTRWKR